MYFNIDSLSFDFNIRQRLKKSSSQLNFFFSPATCGLVQQLILRMFRDLILQSRNSHSLNGDPPVKVNKVLYGKDYALRAVLYLMSCKCDVRVVSCNINKKIKILRVGN